MTAESYIGRTYSIQEHNQKYLLFIRADTSTTLGFSEISVILTTTDIAMIKFLLIEDHNRIELKCKYMVLIKTC